MASKAEQSSTKRVREHRELLRAKGLRPIQFWVPDVRTAAFREEARRQALAVARSPSAAEDQAFIEAITEPGLP
ncbi:MAG: antitoxin MazE family protein [Dehalococcoidia bacterium]|nr:antitoxin MazE family protein [Dehalococcoidia bacterium]